MSNHEWPQSTKQPCVRCRAKGIVVCPECQGTGEKRNTSYVVVGRCRNCEKVTKGFIVCPTCFGEKLVEDGQLRVNRRLEAERLRGIPTVWGFSMLPAPQRILAPGEVVVERKMAG